MAGISTSRSIFAKAINSNCSTKKKSSKAL
ncbi:Uncharacterised protein [Vibrio cholerae]|nr:Uncharacterised protein [Vibrio cholerae]